jgi:hypothetical protein
MRGMEAPGAGPHAGSMKIAAALLAVTIRVYDLYGMPPEERQQALEVAAQTLAHAGVEVTWVNCVRPDWSPSGDAQMKPHELVLRIHNLRHRSPQVLGNAVVQDDGRNVLATVFTPALADRQARTGVPLPSLVGRVAAHEIGHLLLGRNSHSPHGLMRAGWNVKEVHKWLWEFSEQDVARIHERARERQAQRLASAEL